MCQKQNQVGDKIEEEKPVLTITERDAKGLMNEITDICQICQTAFILPEATEINQSANFYIGEIMRALKEYNIIAD